MSWLKIVLWYILIGGFGLKLLIIFESQFFCVVKVGGRFLVEFIFIQMDFDELEYFGVGQWIIVVLYVGFYKGVCGVVEFYVFDGWVWVKCDGVFSCVFYYLYEFIKDFVYEVCF